MNKAPLLPRREMGGLFILNEQKWLPVITPSLPLETSVPIRIGQPWRDYPWTWSVVPWIEGETADLSPLADDQVNLFADFLHALHRPAPDEAPKNPYRGVPLRTRAEATEERFPRVQDATGLITPEILHVWQMGLDAPNSKEVLWLHGDLHPRNIIVKDGALKAIIDWGDICAGDVASDLASIWMLFGLRDIRQKVMDLYDTDDANLWVRARGWAVFYGVVLLDAGLVDDPRHASIGETVLKRISDETSYIAN